jgi:DNA polymerase III epsilon subunit-like protein
VAIVPLGVTCYPATWNAFTVEIKPTRLDCIDSPHLTEERLKHLLENGKEAGEALELFEKWFANLELAGKIAPLGQNYGFDCAFLQEWMGAKAYQARFDYHTRDSQAAATFLNDKAERDGMVIPFPFTNLKGLCEVLKVENEKAHSALADALACAECYRRMLSGWF